jgi:hypothetical protein
LDFNVSASFKPNAQKYLREADCSKQNSLQKIHFNKARALVAGTNKAGRPGQAGGAGGAGLPGHLMFLLSLPIFLFQLLAELARQNKAY